MPFCSRNELSVGGEHNGIARLNTGQGWRHWSLFRRSPDEASQKTLPSYAYASTYVLATLSAVSRESRKPNLPYEQHLL
ncbi:hypothetical protein BD311DRAFT_781724 [Dichomitus squalens]|uniref:Uncharacterized protein n=1 Tax=Dichomitus squalens TaxID=114155 RepID=A0A4Q9M8T0_9APHY|nr:hypothetical protein BD311DRAFT_781724 [Dichomitus squalens]